MEFQDRRKFLKVTALSALGAVAMRYGFYANAAQKTANIKSNIGVQIYSIRDSMNKDVPGSLKQVADIGYKYLELAGYSDGKFYGHTPEEFKKMVNDMGMEIISSHTIVETKDAEAIAEAHAKLGVKYCVQPVSGGKNTLSADSYKKYVSELNAIGNVMKKNNIQFGYHNHDFEFKKVDGITPYTDILLAESDPKLLTFEIDIYWATRAGFEPVKLFREFPGRFELFHMKDMEAGEDKFFAPVGEGVINFEEILKNKETAGMKYMFVEQDSTRDGKAMDAIAKSFSNIKNKLLK